MFIKMWVSGNIQVNQNGRNVDIGVKKNNTGQIISPLTVRCQTQNVPYGFALTAYMSDVTATDYFELFVTSSTNTDVVLLQDLTWFFEAK